MEGIAFRPGGHPGHGVDGIASDLRHAGGPDIKKDEAWGELKDLRGLRNLIVHRAGTRIDSNDAERLERKYKGDLEYEGRDDDWFHQIWVSMNLCRHFADTLEKFLQDTLEDVNALVPPERGLENRRSPA